MNPSFHLKITFKCTECKRDLSIEQCATEVLFDVEGKHMTLAEMNALPNHPAGEFIVNGVKCKSCAAFDMDAERSLAEMRTGWPKAFKK